MDSFVHVTLLTVAVMLTCQQLPYCTGQFFIGRYKTKQDYSLPHHQYHINEVDGPTDTTSSSGRSMLQKRQLFLPFSPLASRGTIYMAFMFLMPLAVRPKLGRSFPGDITSIGDVMEREGKSIYNEMGYIDGNLLLRKTWNQWRTDLLTKWKGGFAFKKYKKKTLIHEKERSTYPC